MPFLLTVLHLAGAVMLLLYAVHLVRTGAEQGFGPLLRRLLGEGKASRLGAASSGLVMALLLQSSTAVAVIACGFAASGMLTVPTGLALLLGADLGSALVVRALFLDLNWLAPICLATGVAMHLRSSPSGVRDAGQMVLGVGLLLLSLSLIGHATEPIRESQLLLVVSAYLQDDYLTAFVLGAAFAWFVHSGVATVLLVATFAARGLISLDAAVAVVLGANLGAGMIAFWLSRGMRPEVRRLPTGNLAFRAVAAVVVLLGLELSGLSVALLGGDPQTALVNFHVAFNACLVVVSLPLCSVMATMLRTLLPDPKMAADEQSASRRVSALDRSVIGNPRLGLASATREVLRMAETVETMFRPIIDLLGGCSEAQIFRIRKLDDDVNRAHTEIKLYIAEMNRGELSLEDTQRGIELTDFAINLEHAGDIVAKSLLSIAAERAERKLRFSKEGWDELAVLHARVVDNMQLALNVLVSNDVASARQLVVEKERMRALERQSHDGHLRRLQCGTAASIETSNLHLEAVRAFKEINSLLVTVAYPILTQNGHLLESRLAKTA